MRSTLVLLLSISLSFQVSAQKFLDSLLRAPDSTVVFTINDLTAFILSNHPVVKQAELLSETARQEIRFARGNFDPKFSLDWQNKEKNGIEYYNKLHSELKVPLRMPVEPKVGVERNLGEYLNPENYVGDEYNYRQVYAGLSLPLGRGLITDERRTTLRQAEVFAELAESERVKQINKILLEAAKDYWSWFHDYYNYLLLRRTLKVSREVFERSRLTFEYGELAAIDTVQAKILVQQREIELKEAELDFNNSLLKVSLYLWDSSANPLRLDPKYIPSADNINKLLVRSELEELKSNAIENHPELQVVRLKLQQLAFERRLRTENLKPQIDLNYNLINKPLTPAGDVTLSGNDYKVGVDVSFSLFLRKERSKLAMTRLKISELSFDEQALTQRIVNEIERTYNSLTILNAVLTQQLEMVLSYEQLFNAELLNVTNGESDLFKLNFQQEKLLQAQTKVIKVIANIHKELSVLNWAAGIRPAGLEN